MLTNLFVFTKGANILSRLNPRSVTAVQSGEFTKVSDELSLEWEAKELNRCKEASIHTPHVRAPELIGYDPKSNILTTQLIENAQSFYNHLWNGTSLPFRIIGKGINNKMLWSRMNEIGGWLKLYHDSTDHDWTAMELDLFWKQS
jgi:hypothetical protein